MPGSKSKSPLIAGRVAAAAGLGAIAVYGAKVLINVFGPQPQFRMQRLGAPLNSEEFVRFLSLVTDGTRRKCRVQRLKNGEEFYPAEIEAIRSAQHAINMEYYEFSPGETSTKILEAMSERAGAGVKVRLIVDAIGSIRTSDRYFDALRKAGGQMRWYHPCRWDTWPGLNQRTHRKLLVVDGRTGFIGGAGIADHWIRATRSGPQWRDTVFRVEGEGVAGLISTFAENWLESAGEILSGPEEFGFHAGPEGAESFVVSSTPRGGGTQARILFQALINSACRSIRITTPYFLPDKSARRALASAARDRGISVQILTAGPYIDHPIVHTVSRRGMQELIRAGAEVYEYQPSMIHAKLMTVDGQWSVVGSTNFDHRSFSLNDEVNLAVLDRDLAAVIDEDFSEDLKKSRRMTVQMLKDRDPTAFLGSAVGHAIRWET